MLTTDQKDAIRSFLVGQAKKCETASGAALLCALSSHIQGATTFENCNELCEVADLYGRKLDAKDEPVAVVVGG